MNIDELSGWGISKQIADVVENGFSYDEETGEIIFTSDDLETLEVALEEKIQSLSGIHLDYLAKAKNFKERSKEILDVSKRYEKKAERLKTYIDNLMKLNGKTKLEIGDTRLSYRKSVSSMITDEEALRKYIEEDEERKAKYYSYKVPEISKKAISDDIKQTKTAEGDYELSIPGFELIENSNLIIK